MSDEKTDKLLKDIKDWLETQGQALEMRVAKVFRENGFLVSQFENIVDQESQSVRQVDVVASLSQEIDGCFLTIRLVIECKYAKSRPWILLLTPQKFDGIAFFSRILQGNSPANWKFLPTLQGRLVSRILLSLDKTELSQFSIEPVGYSVIEADFRKTKESADQDEKRPETKKESKPKDIAFEAIVQVSKSVEAHDADNEEKFKSMAFSFENMTETATNIGSELNLYLSVAMPVIVINGRLFEGHLGDDNQISVSEIENGFVLMPYRQKEAQTKAQVPLSPIVVVTEEHLGKFIPKLQSLLKLLISQDGAIKDLIKFERSKFSKPVSLETF